MHTIPTDCPQRNERMGWMGDAQVFSQAAMYNMDMRGFFDKFITDIRLSQAKEGYYPDFVPHPFPEDKNTFGPGWADAGVIIPWNYYLTYGDRKVLTNHFESMKKFVDCIDRKNPNHLWKNWISNYGDWLNGNTLKAKGYPKKGGALPKDVYATMYFAHSTELVAKMAKVLGKTQEAQHYQTLFDKITNAFNQKYVSKKGKIKGDTQSAYAMALNFGMLPEKLQKSASERLITSFKKYDGRLSTGFTSTALMMLELSKWGFNDKAYELVQSNRFPSWGYSIKQGATTIWERWDAYVEGRGFQNKGMNSFNHYSIGAVGEWMYRVMLGINIDEAHPAFEQIILTPKPHPSIAWVKGEYESVRGRIAVDWKFAESKNALKQLSCEIPPNTTAQFTIPKTLATEIEKMSINGQPISTNPSLKILSEGNHEGIILQLPSGTYHFQPIP